MKQPDEVRRQKRRDYRAKDPERWREYARAYYAANADKARENERAWHAANPRKRWATKIKQKYGLTPEAFEAMRVAQGDGCAICHTPFGERLPHVDHDHATGVVRGLLCNKCNVGLGFYERPGFAVAAASYLGSRKPQIKLA